MGASANADRATAASHEARAGLRQSVGIPSAARLCGLATLCEDAEGPDRGLDAAIAVALSLPNGKDSGWCNNENGDYWVVEECAKMFTASVDAALTLAPEGWSVTLHAHKDDQSRASVWWGGHAYDFRYAATPALAITAAALRARASGTEAGTAETVEQGSVHEGPVGGNAETPTTDRPATQKRGE